MRLVKIVKLPPFTLGGELKDGELSDCEIASLVRKELGAIHRGQLHWGKTTGGVLVLSTRELDEFSERRDRS